MENPHEAEQTVLLERIIKNVDKCNEAIMEMNVCLQEIIQSSSSVQMAAQLNEHYSAGVANYMRNLDIMPDPK